MRILVAPDKFKSTLDAATVARTLADAVRASLPDAEVRAVPLADGGEGTIDALRSAGGLVIEVAARGPLGGPLVAPMLVDSTTAVVEVAAVCGLGLLREPQPLDASTEGVGDLLLRAVELGARRVVVAVGGTSSTDGGTGLARALGWRFLDRRGRDLPPGGGPLGDLAAIVRPERDPLEIYVVGACDVSSPVLGPHGAAAVFGPQKGATAADVERLEAGLSVLIDRLRLDLGIDAEVPAAGAGGALGAGLLAFCRAELRPGFDVVAGLVGLDRSIEWADAIVTGEGRFDAGSLAGKTPVALARRAAGTPIHLIAGDIALDPSAIAAAGFTSATSLREIAGDGSVTAPESALRAAVEVLALRLRD